MKNLFLILIITVFLEATFIKDSYGIPAFSRKYKTSCITCHYAIPKLNAFGKAFFNNGYRWPGGDENFIKEPPVNLGAEANKKAFPDAVWPADIPGTAPISVFASGSINYNAAKEVKWRFEIPQAVNILYGGTIGENFSFFGSARIEDKENNTEISFPVALQYDYSPELHIRAGDVRSDPTSRHLRLTHNNYNIANFESRNGWSFSDDQFGLEVWGALNGFQNRGGLTYRFGVVNGKGLTDNNPQKDFYGKITYKFGGFSEIGVSKGVKKRKNSVFYIDNSLTIGGFFYKGTATKDSVKDENITVLGGNLDLWFSRFILNSTVMAMNSELSDTTNKRRSVAYYIQGNGVIFPWLIGILRYEWEDKDIDNEYVKPVKAIISSINVLPRANIKLIFEFKKFLDEINKMKDTFVLQIDFAI